jgi:Holliday junction resolvasome RuvABC endonuclease subunit
MKVLSIDIGIKNLGYSILDTKINELSFDTIKLENDNIIQRCESLYNLIGNIEPDMLIVERQVPTNISAMGLMYSVITCGIQCGANITVFDPKLKFTTLHETYDTTNKKHKKKSIAMTRNLLFKLYPSLLIKFDDHKKKDDVADAILQLFVQLLRSNYLNINVDQFIDLIK